MGTWRTWRTEAPAGPAVTLEDAKAHLRVTHALEDDLIGGLVAAAVAHIDGPGGWLGRALLSQELRMQGDGFEERIRLRYPPLIEVLTVTCIDRSGETLELVEGEDWRVVGSGQDGPAWLLPADGKAWPATRWREDAVTITYRAGYGENAADLPEDIRQALLLLVGHWYRNREEVVVGMR